MSQWLEQWQRVNRWYRRFTTINEGRSRQGELTSDDYQDEVYAFFQNCYHLKDWLRNDPSVATVVSDLEDVLLGPKTDRSSGSLPFQLCADLALGSKHLKVTTPKVDSATQIGKRHFDVNVYSGGEPRSSTLAVKYEVHAGGKVYDAYTVATDSIDTWNRYLRDRGLLP
jgi:hypothetical protein